MKDVYVESPCLLVLNEMTTYIIARVIHTTTHAEIATHLSKFGVHRFAIAQLLLLRSLEKALHLKVNPFNS